MGATKGLEAAAITWDDGPNGKVSNADIVKQLEEESKSRAWLPVTMAILGRIGFDEWLRRSQAGA